MRRPWPRFIAIAALLALGLLRPGLAAAQQLQLQVESEELHANLPFVLTVVASGFDETPQPTLSKLAIGGCKVTPLGVQPNVSNMVQIINGRRSESRAVVYGFRFRVEAPRPGEYTIPALQAQQGQKRAESRAARFSVKAVEETSDMQVRLQLPARPLWVGETVEGALEWYLRRNVSNRTFVVPLFDLEDWVEVEAGPSGPSDRRLGGFHAGARALELPFQQEKATLDGVEYTRFRFLFRLTPVKVGALQLAPPRVMAELETGVGRDSFGFQTQLTKLFQAAGKGQRLEVRPLPLANRPASFKNAVGAAFSLEVQAGRTVVRVGDPVELRVLVRGKGRLAGLILPDLRGAGLAPEEFAVPDEPPAGELLDDGKGKLFRVSVRLRSAAVRQIPALSFTSFEPDKGAYETVRSQPIALSVQGSAVVGAADVVAGRPAEEARPAGPARDEGRGAAPAPASPQSLVGAELALSAEGATLRRGLSLGTLWPLLLLLYAAPLGLLGVLVARQRGAGARQAGDRARGALAALDRELEAAGRAPAREAAPKVAAALRALGRQRQGGPEPQARALLERLETEAYHPEAGERPLDAALRAEVGRLGRALLGLVTLLLAISLPRPAQGAPAAEPRLAEARVAYQGALSQGDRDRRREGFALAEALLREQAAAHGDCPELQADWGTAALLAQEPGRAVLGLRRALRLDPGLGRARRNLGFVRDRLPEWLPRPREGGALDTLLFWQRYLPIAGRHLAAALAFALAVLLLCPLAAPPGRRRLLRGLAIGPALVFFSMILSAIVTPEGPEDAVLVLPAVLRSADNLGAPPAFAHPLPMGAEVRVRELRPEWARVELADGQGGWLPASAVERVR